MLITKQKSVYIIAIEITLINGEQGCYEARQDPRLHFNWIPDVLSLQTELQRSNIDRAVPSLVPIFCELTQILESSFTVGRDANIMREFFVWEGRTFRPRPHYAG